MAVELAILTPVVIAMLLVVVAFGRVTQARQLVDQAAAAGARAASLSASPGQAASEARQSVQDTLSQAGVSCSSAVVDVDTTGFRPGGQVGDRVRCTVDLSAMALIGIPGTLTLTADAQSPIETYRDVATTGAP
jgi:Flp pilus assembly protein TadG